ncbi:MAG TPA: histidine kinase [Geobacter sp.]|nr:histidine kinase [Geobacter sp.]
MIAVWTLFIVLLAALTLHLQHLGTIRSAQSEARDYFSLNRSYRAWAAGMGGLYVPADKVAPNPYLDSRRRTLTTREGKELTLVNPAYMTRIVFESLKASSPNPVVSKITSLKPLNPSNAPDPWEREALAAFERGEGAERTEVTTLYGKPYLRFMSRFMTEQDCLDCHGQQGYRLGDVRGGIAISIPLAGYYATESRNRNNQLAGYLLLWGVGSTGIALSSRRRSAYQDKLRESEEKFRTICDWTQDWEYWIDQHGAMKYVSPSCLEHTGYRPEEFLEDPDLVSSLVHPEDLHLFHEHLVQGSAAEQPPSQSIEYRIVTRDGLVRWMHHACRPVFSRGQYLGHRVSSRDVTERKLAQQELAVRAELLNWVSDSVLVIDRSGRIVDANETSWRTRGFTRVELLSMSFADLSSAEHAARVGQRLESIFEKGAAFLESEHRLKDGGTIHVEVNTRVIDYRGEPAILSSIRDITERRRAEQSLRQAEAALRENESKLRVIFDVMQAGIIQMDPAGVVSFANQRMAEMLGLPMAELLGSAYCSHIPAEQRQAAQLHLQQLLDRETESFHYERRYQRKDGSEFWGYITGRRLTAPDGRSYSLVATIADMTELKSAEEKRHKSEQQMLHVQKLESLGVLAGGIAHDFNNILLAIMGNVSLALYRVSPGSAVEPHLQQIERAAEKAADLARQMLAYSGKGRFVLESLDLNQLVQEMTAMLEVSISKKAALRCHLGQKLPCIVADPTQMRQIVMNLAINASEAIGERSGVISIATGSRFCDRGYLCETWLNDELPEGDYVFLEVADTGCGMDQETIGRIFEPFFTTKFTGRGLGMAAILGIVRGHKGAIKVYSEPGRGSSFRVYFPSSGEPVLPIGRAPGCEQWRGEGTVLLVDDEETIRAIGSEMLSELGFDVLNAADGREALQLYRLKGDQITLVLMDLNMPQLSGEETFHELRSIDPLVRVVLSSGFSEQEVTRKFLGKGLAGFVQKPYTLGTLRDTLSRLL